MKKGTRNTLLIKCPKHKQENLHKMKYYDKISYVQTDYLYCKKCKKAYKIKIRIGLK